ncbi:hypothetical protein N7481_001609 [Penicillium waksmanii]|uniref:uncharacterized protein n=1 Tax=Penicillium waksmanii TaxID=69791 RepID=UPI00254841F9|nr:uncharacterized protein N7481_001609 [Penicillium waksmanii]KAJ6001200.1 hypothetical protein N7481_001609 [Penicillium waksmanii]
MMAMILVLQESVCVSTIQSDLYSPPSETSSSTQLSIIESLSKKPKLSIIAQLQENLLRWFIKDKVAFTTIESPSFRQIFTDLGHDAALFSRHTLKRRIEAEFQRQRLQLKTELALTCRSIALSLDVWTSKNNISIIAIIGHWLTPEFTYKQKALEFAELDGAHSGENLAHAVFNMLLELDLQTKLLTITGDNASNNEAMVSLLYDLLPPGSQFHGLGSYIRCLAHILNLIVKDILHVLDSGTAQEASKICDHMKN